MHETCRIFPSESYLFHPSVVGKQYPDVLNPFFLSFGLKR